MEETIYRNQTSELVSTDGFEYSVTRRFDDIPEISIKYSENSKVINEITMSVDFAKAIHFELGKILFN
jgi:hypothetical protein